MKYTKNGQFSTCKVLVIDGFKVINPTHEQILSQGWEVYIPPTIEPNPNDGLIARHKEVLQLLALTDNEVTRHLEGNPSTTWSNFDELKAQRELWRSEMNEIEESLGMKWNPLTNQFERNELETLR